MNQFLTFGPMCSMHQFLSFGPFGSMQLFLSWGPFGSMQLFLSWGPLGSIHQFLSFSPLGSMHQFLSFSPLGSMHEFLSFSPFRSDVRFEMMYCKLQNRGHFKIHYIPNDGDIETKDVSGAGRIALGRFITWEVSSCYVSSHWEPFVAAPS